MPGLLDGDAVGELLGDPLERSDEGGRAREGGGLGAPRSWRWMPAPTRRAAAVPLSAAAGATVGTVRQA